MASASCLQQTCFENLKKKNKIENLKSVIILRGAVGRLGWLERLGSNVLRGPVGGWRVQPVAGSSPASVRGVVSFLGSSAAVTPCGIYGLCNCVEYSFTLCGRLV